MRLILTRHGETVQNKEGLVQGHGKGTLSAEGLDQARKLSIRLKDEKIDFIYSSDLERASETTKEIAKYHKNVPVVFSKEARERFLGSLQGMKLSEIDWSEEPDDIETKEAMKERAKKFLLEIFEKHRGENVLVVSHGGFNRSLLAYIKGIDCGEIFNMDKPKNTSVYIINFDDEMNAKIELENCVNHLKT